MSNNQFYETPEDQERAIRNDFPQPSEALDHIKSTYDTESMKEGFLKNSEKVGHNLELQNNYLKVGRSIECGHCHPEKFAEGLKQAERSIPNFKCDCTCHDTEPQKNLGWEKDGINCWICRTPTHEGDTLATIHTGCMALLTPNEEVEDRIEGVWEAARLSAIREFSEKVKEEIGNLRFFKLPDDYCPAELDIIDRAEEILHNLTNETLNPNHEK